MAHRDDKRRDRRGRRHRQKALGHYWMELPGSALTLGLVAGWQWPAAGLSGSQNSLGYVQYCPVAVLAEKNMDQVVGLNWSADSTMLASNAIDGTVLIWEDAMTLSKR